MADEPDKPTDTPEYGCLTNPFTPAAPAAKKGADVPEDKE
jgi:hypothetical protein